jgi:hypothetical protein
MDTVGFCGNSNITAIRWCTCLCNCVMTTLLTVTLLDWRTCQPVVTWSCFACGMVIRVSLYTSVCLLIMFHNHSFSPTNYGRLVMYTATKSSTVNPIGEANNHECGPLHPLVCSLRLHVIVGAGVAFFQINIWRSATSGMNSKNSICKPKL